MKILAILLLAGYLLGPQYTFETAKPGENIVAVVIDNSRSMQANDQAELKTFLNWFASDTPRSQGPISALRDDFRLRLFSFGERLHGITSSSEIDFSETGSQLHAAIERINSQYQNQPLAGIILVSDGQSSDAPVRNDQSVPIFPVLSKSKENFADVWLLSPRVQVSNFESAPITLGVPIRASQLENETVLVHLLDQDGNQVDQQEFLIDQQDWSANAVFRFRPEKSGPQIYELAAALKRERIDLSEREVESKIEKTRLNNFRQVAINPYSGPYRALYVAGRPNWEHKFLARALASDEEVQLISLLRIAKANPKFTFRDQTVADENSLFAGFEDVDEEEKGKYDEPVLLRLGVRDGQQLSEGFPKDAEELFDYDCVILDDIEADFFTQQQLLLIRRYCAQRGGGLLLLAGQESFQGKSFAESALGELAPFYPPKLERNFTSEKPTTAPEVDIELSREGWLEPFLRLADTESKQRNMQRDAPEFQVFHARLTPKPGARVLASGVNQTSPDQESDGPAMLTQKFGQGKVVAFAIGDYWRWAFRKKDDEQTPPVEQSWRQLVRWMMSDVQKRLSVERDTSGAVTNNQQLNIRVLDPSYEPAGQAQVQVEVTDPAGETFRVPALPSMNEVGQFVAKVPQSLENGYRAQITASVPGTGQDLVTEIAWVHEPMVNEMESLGIHRDNLQELANQTGGRVIEWSEIAKMTSVIPNERIPIKETVVEPLWHRWYMLVLAAGCFCIEWFIRRRHGMK